MAVASNGTSINVGDPVCVAGECRAVSGSGQKATITVLLDNNQLVQCLAGDCFATPLPGGTAVSENGVAFGAGSQVTIKGTVSGVMSPTVNAAATVTVTTKSNSAVTSVSPTSVKVSKTHST